MQTEDGDMSKATSGQVEPAGAGEDSGRFAIDAERRAVTVVPPTTPEAEELSLDALIDVAPAATKPVTVPPPGPAHARSHASGLAPARSRAPVAAAPEAEVADEGGLDSLRPFYKDLGAPRERAEVDIADLTLRADNPYLASSLIPPAQEPSAFGRMLVGVAAVIALLSGGYFVFGRTTATPASPPVVAAARTEPATEQAAVPVEPAPSVDVQAVEAARVVEAAPVAEAVPVVEAAPEQPVAAKLPAPAVAAPVEAPAAARATAPVESPAAVAGDTKPAAPAAVVAAETAPPAATAPAATAPTATAAAPTEAVAAEPASAGAPVAVAAVPPTDLPATPTREEVAAGFDALRPDLLQCAAGKPGVVIIDATLAGAGRVAYALVDGKDFKGTPEGSCMARAIRKAHFPQFAQDTLKVRYPVQL